MSSESVFNCRDAAVPRCAAAGGNATAISATCKAAHSRRVPWEPWASRPFPGAFHFCRPASATLAYPKKKEKKNRAVSDGGERSQDKTTVSDPKKN